MNRWIPKLLALAIGFGTTSPLAAQPSTAQLSQRRHGLAMVSGTLPADGAAQVRLDTDAVLSFTAPLDPNSVDEVSLRVIANGSALATDRVISIDRKSVTLNITGYLPGDSDVSVIIDGSRLRDANGNLVDADGNQRPGGVRTITFHTNPALPIPVSTDSARITGFVYSINTTTGALTPFNGADIVAQEYPASPAGLIWGSTSSGTDGFFELVTLPFTGSKRFLVAARFANYTESERDVTILAGRCQRVDDAIIQQLTLPVFVMAADGAVISDPDDGVTLTIPPGALAGDSLIQVTMFHTADALRAQLPDNVSSAGVFVDIAGVFGEVSTAPVTLRVPNTYNLPLGTRVPFGKVDHFTLEWIDLRDIWTGPGAAPDSFLGTVVSNGAGGTSIDVQFDHFCNICTGYCLPFTGGGPTGGGPLPPPGPKQRYVCKEPPPQALCEGCMSWQLGDGIPADKKNTGPDGWCHPLFPWPPK